MERNFGVIFDMDGIIFDSERACFECWIEAADIIGVPGMKEFYPSIIGTNALQSLQMTKDAYDGILGEGTAERLQSLSSEIFHGKYDEGGLPLKKGAEQILRFLRNEGIKTGLASSTRTRQVIRELTNEGLIGYFDSVTGGDSVTVSKPDPQIYLIACEKLGSVPSRTFAIEDSFNGIRSASRAGMRPLMVPDMIPPDDEMRSLCEGIFPDLVKVREYLEGLLRNPGAISL